MENMLIQDLDKILKSIIKLNEKYQHLSTQNQKLKEEIEVLKVVSDQYKEENIKIKEEWEKKEAEEDKSLLLKSDKLSGTDVEALVKNQTEKNAAIKVQLDGFIEDIDQCIQITQAKD